MKDRKQFFLIVVCCMAAGVIAAALAEYYKASAYLGWLSAIGEGLIVAGVLAITVDLYLKKHLTEAVIRDVSPHLMGADLPSVLRHEIHALCATEVIRRDLEIDFIFRELPGEPDYLVFTTRVQYLIENLSDYAQPISLICTVAKPYKATANFIQIETVGGIGFLDDAGGPLKFEDRASATADLGTDETVGDDVPRFRKWSREAFVPPQSQETTTRFWSTTHQILPIEFQDAFISIHPTIGQIVRATYPESLSVNVQFGHRLYKQVHAIPTTRPSSWRLEKAFPGRSTTMIEWRKRPTPVPQKEVEEIIVIADSDVPKSGASSLEGPPNATATPA